MCRESNLEKNLQSGHRLRFQDDGSFRVLALSDFQEGLDCDARTLAALRALTEAAKPQLVVLCGDNIDHTKIHTADELQRYLAMICAEFEERHIPWAHVNGNHDHDLTVPAGEQMAVYTSFPMCVTKTVEGIHGSTNWFLPIWSPDGSAPMAGVWGLDSNNSRAAKNFPPPASSGGKPYTQPTLV